MTFTATPQPVNVPPRVRLDFDTDDAGGSFTALAVSRDGALIREQPFVGGPQALTYDYEALFGVPTTYTVEGTFLPSSTPDWSESWASLAAWTGSGFTVSGGLARSTVTGATIVRSASGMIQRLTVTSPTYVRVELLTAADVLVASVQVGANVIVAGTTSTSVSGGGSFTASLVGGTLSVQAVDSSWSASRSYTGTPTKVRIVSLGISYPSSSFSTVGGTSSIALDSAGNVYVWDYNYLRVRKFSPAGAALLSFVPGVGTGIVGIAVDSTGSIYLLDSINKLVRKYGSTGVAGITWSTTGSPTGIAVDSANSVYVTDQTNKLVRKYSSAGVAGITFSTSSIPYGVAVDSAGSIYVATSGGTLRKYSSAGVAGITWSTTGSSFGVATHPTTNDVFVADTTNKLVRKYSSTGVADTTFPTVGSTQGVVADASNVYATDNTNQLVRKFVATGASVGVVSVGLPASEQPFSASATVTLSVAAAWLIHPSAPSLSAPIDPGAGLSANSLTFVEASSGEQKQSQADRAIHRPVGRDKAVIVTHGPRQADEWTLVLTAPDFATRDNLRALVNDQTPLLLRADQAPDWDLPDGWYSVGDLNIVRVSDPVLNKQTLITMPLTPVDEPIVRQGAVWTYGGDLLINASYADSRADFPTYFDRLAGPAA